MKGLNEVALIFILMAVFLALIFLKVPVAYALAVSSLVVILLLDMPVVLLIERMYASLEYYPLLAIPFFMLLGQLMASGQVMDRLLDLSDALVGHVKGGLAHINVLVSMFMAGVSGTSTSDTAGVGSVLIPAMTRSGFPLPFSVAITAASSTMGTIIPPSVLMVVYGSVSGVSISKLFLAGAIPGVLIGVGQMVYSYVLAKKYDWPSTPRSSIKEIFRACLRGLPILGVPLIVIGGILAGFFTATEAGAIAAIYALILSICYKDITSLGGLFKIIKNAARTVALPLFAIAASTIFGWLIAYLKVPHFAANFILSFTDSPYVGMLFIWLIYFIVGMFIDGVPAIIIFLPVALGIGNAVGINELQLALLVCMTASLGLITPPFGLCLLFASKLGNLSVSKATVAVLPFILIFILIQLLIIAVPQVATWLPNLIVQ